MLNANAQLGAVHNLDRKDIKLEMTLFDKFGPLTREALRGTVKDFNAAKLFAKFNRPMVYAGRPRMPDLHDPEIDKMIAEFVTKQMVERFGGVVSDFVPSFKRLEGRKGLNPT